MNMYYRLVAGARIDFVVIRSFVRPSVVSMHNVPASGTVRRTVIALTGVPYCHRGLLFDSFEWGNLSISVRTSSALADAVAAQYFEIFG
jgi:hypothetical protein